MPEVARILAFVSAFLMVMSFAIWVNWLRGPLLQRLDGLRVSNAGPAGFSIRLLMLAFVLSALAAALAIVGWISP